MKLLTKQENAVFYLKDNITEEILYGGAAGGGKSALGCLWIIEGCQKYPGSRWLIGRTSLKTLKETTLATFFELCARLDIVRQFHYNDNKSQLTHQNGSVILLKDLMFYPSDPEFVDLGSLELTGAFIDECNQVVFKAWQIVKSRIRYKLTEFNLIPKLLGTCNPAKNWVYHTFYNPSKDGTIEPFRKFIGALPKDNSHLHPSYLQSLLRLDKDSRERLYYGNWEYDDDPAALIKFQAILNMFTATYVAAGDKYISADIARFGSDTTTIIVWDGLRTLEIKQLQGQNTISVAGQINAYRETYKVPLSNIIADEDGVGGGLVDILQCKGFVNNSSPLFDGNFNHLKSQCYYKLAELINEGEVYVNCTDSTIRTKLSEELEQVKRHNMDKDTKMMVVPKDLVKEAIGRSPDISDALMMRMYYELSPARKRGRNPV